MAIANHQGDAAAAVSNLLYQRHSPIDVSLLGVLRLGGFGGKCRGHSK